MRTTGGLNLGVLFRGHPSISNHIWWLSEQNEGLLIVKSLIYVCVQFNLVS